MIQLTDKETCFRSSHPEVFLGKGVLKICSKCTGEHLCRSAISIKLQSNFIEMALRHGCSPVNLLHIFRTPFPRNTSGWLLLLFQSSSNSFRKSIPAGIYLLKFKNRNTRTRCKICPKLTIKIAERCHCRRSGIFIVNFEHISHLVLVFLLLTLNR